MSDKVETKTNIVQDIRIVHAEFDTAIPESRFRPVMQTDSYVIDMTPTLPTTFPVVPVNLPEADVPIRAGVLVSDAAFMSLAGAVLSLAVFLVAFLLCRRSA